MSHLKRAVLIAAGLTLSGCNVEKEPLYRVSTRTFLKQAWESYKRVYIDPSGFVLDRSRNQGEVTSEGQSYALMRAVWIDDSETFDRVLEWTEANLRRPDGLYSWRWSPTGKVLDVNSATDADEDISFALILASHHFRKPYYLDRARELLQAIRLHAGLQIQGGWFPSAGNWAVADRIVNLSYFAPYAHPYFQRADPEGKWETSLEIGYDLMERTLKLPNVKLIPDFMRVSEANEVELLSESDSLSRDFSFDAMRLFWRVALDCRLHSRPRACSDPAGGRRLMDLLARDGRLVTRYRVDGTPLASGESLSFYGSLLPAPETYSHGAALEILTRRLSPQSLLPLLANPQRYYDLNWVWFGLAAQDGLIRERTPEPSVLKLD